MDHSIDLFYKGENGYDTFRIPALLALPNSTILAFCEGRRYNDSDFGNIDMVMKRSVDGGLTWGPMRVIWDLGELAVQNPCPVHDKDTGTVFLHVVADRRDHFLLSSKDLGLTWSSPVELQHVRKEGWFFAGPCPGHAIQTRAGRLVVPGMYSAEPNRKSPFWWGSHFVYSDDHGASWQLGHDFDLGSNEFLCAELSSGSLLSVLRPNIAGDSTNVRVSISNDGGVSSSPIVIHDDLVSPICQSSIVRETRHESTLLFSNPADATERANMTIKISRDDGKTWSVLNTIYPGPSGYSDLAVLEDGTICCLFERGQRDYREVVTFIRLERVWELSQ